jgi:hypothetical protein
MHLLRTSLAATALWAAMFISPLAAGDLKLGMQTWTLRNLDFEQSVKFCAKHGIKYLQPIPNHLDLDDRSTTKVRMRSSIPTCEPFFWTAAVLCRFST